jgi:hypothetical protein
MARKSRKNKTRKQKGGFRTPFQTLVVNAVKSDSLDDYNAVENALHASTNKGSLVNEENATGKTALTLIVRDHAKLKFWSGCNKDNTNTHKLLELLLPHATNDNALKAFYSACNGTYIKNTLGLALSHTNPGLLINHDF